MYSDVRKMMAQTYPASDFGDVDIPVEDTNALSKQELILRKRKIDNMFKLKKEGYNRVKNKIK